jgi:hypothetical protein
VIARNSGNRLISFVPWCVIDAAKSPPSRCARIIPSSRHLAHNIPEQASSEGLKYLFFVIWMVRFHSASLLLRGSTIPSWDAEN